MRMNQILVSDKLYVTNKLKKKKKMYKIQFIASIILVFIFSGWYIYTEVEKNACEAVSQDMLADVSFSDDTTSDEPLIVALDDTEILGDDTKTILDGSYTDENGVTYTYEAVLNIPTLGIEYPVLTETSEELLKISLTKFWGGSPNSVGNYCVAGHNYKSGKMFGKLSQIQVGDLIKLTDLSGTTVDYKVYNKYTVYPEDVSCTSQITNGLKEMTLITCTNGGKQRLIVKCREV
jgi:LPXTG-site transpeptidase (sortase) family protein